MRKLLPYMKKSVPAIICIILLLIVQAVADLKLPGYTSEIVDVGIQQCGIKSPVFAVIRAEKFDELNMLIDGEDAEKLKAHYSLSKCDKKKYPKAYDTDVYVLGDVSKEQRAELEEILSEAEPINMMLASDEYSEVLPPELINDKKPQELDNYLKMFGVKNLMELLELMPEENRRAITDRLHEEIDKMSDMAVSQAALLFVKTEYRALGADMDGIQIKYIMISGLKMLGVALIAVAAAVLTGYFSARAAASVGHDLRAALFNKVVTFSGAEFNSFSTASLITRSTNDIQQVQMLVMMLLRTAFYAPITGIGGVIKVSETKSGMSFIILLSVLAVAGLVAALFFIAVPKFKTVQKLIDRVNLVSREILNGLPVIRAFRTERYEEERFNDANTNLMKIQLFVNRTMAFMMPVMMLIMNCTTLAIIYIGAKKVDAELIQVGDIMAFIQYSMHIIASFLMISMFSIMLPRAAVSAGRISEVLSTEAAIKDPEEIAEFDESKRGMVEFDHVTFRYPKAEDDVLKDITFTAKPSETTAIIGSTGSGKTTILNLIPRLYDVTSGSVKVGGVDVRRCSQHSLRERIGFVPQKGVLFSGTIESNLKYGCRDASDEEMALAVRIAQAEEFILKKDDGYGSEISQGGTNVSGGQKQRLSIARAVIKKPDILIFDDSFSALDYRTDAALRKALHEYTSDAAVIIVAQRINTIRNADNIIVLDEGRIVGSGTHRYLLENCEIYRQTALSQLSPEELRDDREAK